MKVMSDLRFYYVYFNFKNLELLCNQLFYYQRKDDHDLDNDEMIIVFTRLSTMRYLQVHS